MLDQYVHLLQICRRDSIHTISEYDHNPFSNVLLVRSMSFYCYQPDHKSNSLSSLGKFWYALIIINWCIFSNRNQSYIDVLISCFQLFLWERGFLLVKIHPYPFSYKMDITSTFHHRSANLVEVISCWCMFNK